MKKKIAFVIMAVLISGCAQRLPQPKRAEKLIFHYFHHYAKKYPTTAFGQFPVMKVEFISQQEIHKHLTTVDAYLTLKNGDIRKISATLEKRALLWRFRSWENPEGS